MWNKLSSTFKGSKPAPDEYPQAGPSSHSPSKRKSASLRLLSSPLHKVKSTFNLHPNASQLTVASQELLTNTNTAPRPKATRRSSFNLLLARRPSLDALRPSRRQSIDALRSPPRLPPEPLTPSPSLDYTRERAATVSGSGSVRSILREPNTPGAGKNVRFFAHGQFDLDGRTHVSRSTPPEEVVFQHSSPPKGSFRRLSSSKSSNRPSVVDIFAPLDSATSFFGQLDVPSIPSSPVASSHALDAAIELAAQRRDHNKTPTTSHSRNASFSSQSVLSSKRSSSSKSSISDVETSFTTTSSSSSVSRNIECVSETTTGTGDPFGVHSKTYYTPQTMIPTTPPNGTSRHVRRASKEESIIFSLQAQLAMQNELRGQYEADLRARDELVAVLRKKLEEAEEEDAKKRKFLKAWKRKVLELEKTCRMLDEEVETSRQESMERSVMDEASSEALRMLHRQIAALERERDAWKKTETVLREELRRLEVLVGERRNEAAMLRASLGSLEKEAKQKEEQAALQELKGLVETLEEQLDAEKRKQDAVEKDFEAQLSKLERNNAELLAEIEINAESVQSRDNEVARLKLKLDDALDSAEKAARSLKASEAGTCSLAMERDAMKMQLLKLQQRKTHDEEADRKVSELEDDLQDLGDVNKSLQRERDQLQSLLEAADADKQRLCVYEEDARRKDAQAQQQAAEIEELRKEMSKMKQEHSAALDEMDRATATRQAKLETDAAAEILHLKQQVLDLQQENASKEVSMLQISKERAQDKQDLEGLNIALDAKQQELELLKRRLGVRGTAGSNTAPPPKTTATISRRDSVIHAPPRIPRPSSIVSESENGRERKASTESKMSASNRSPRLSSSTAKGTCGSMGPPPSTNALRSRPSVLSNTPRTLRRSSSAAYTAPSTKPKVAKPPAPAASTSLERNEKENSDVPASRRLSRIPTLAM